MNPRHEPLVVKRVTRRLIPFAFLCYVVAYIDRVNIGFAADALQRDLGLSDAAYGVGAGLFFLGYCLFEIPNNLILERVGARRWMARIMVLWGLVSMGTMFVTDTTTFYVARVLLGIAEAGFFPGMALDRTVLDSCGGASAHGCALHDGRAHRDVVGAPASEALLKLDGLAGIARVAMAVRYRRPAGGHPRRGGVVGAHRQARAGHMAERTRACVARGHDETGTRRFPRKPPGLAPAKPWPAAKCGCSPPSTSSMRS